MSMKLLTNLYIAILLLLCSINLNGQIASEKTKVLILGTPHLNQIPNFQPKMLDNLVIKLDSLKFDAVCIENMPGELLYDIESREDSAYTYIVEHIAGLRFALADSMQVNLGIGFVESEKNAKDLLKKWEAGDKEIINVWKLMNGWVYKGFNKTYNDLGVDFDSLYYESDTYLIGKDIITHGLDKQIFFKYLNKLRI